MRRIVRLPLLLVLLFVPGLLTASDEKSVVEQVIAVGCEDNQVMEHLDFLVNRFGPRLTGSDNLQNAMEWVRDTLAGFGLENARLEPYGEFPVGFNRGPWFGRMLTPTERTLHFGTHAWTAGTKGVVRGRALFAPENAEQLKNIKPILAGAWILVGRPGAWSSPSREFQPKLDAAYQEAKVAGFIRPSAGELIYTGGNPHVSWDKLPTIPEINLLRKEYEEIAELLSKGEEVRLEFDIRNYFKKGPIKLYNLIADLPGTEWPDQYVIVGGHIDSWDGATGAMDNGTGCAVVIEAARILARAGVRPRRTIRFMLWSGEEQGLLGSRAYIRAHPDLMKKISAVLVDDGGTNYISGITATDTMVSDFEHVFAPVMQLDPAMPFKIYTGAGLPPMIGSDHDSFLAVGVPGFYLLQAGRADYNRVHHTQFDTFDGAIPEYQQHSSIVLAVAALGIADLDHLLPRRRLMGVQLQDLTVQSVMPGSLAEEAGVKPGDVIAKVDGREVASRDELISEIHKGEPKKIITLMRNGQEIELVFHWDKPADNQVKAPGTKP